MEQQDLQKRLLLALVLSFVVFIGFSYFFPPQDVNNSTVKQEKVAHNATPTVTTNNVASSTVETSNQSAAAPMQLDSNSLVTISSDKYIITIDEFARISQVTLNEDRYRTEDGRKLKMLGVNSVKPLEVRFADTNINAEAFKTPYVYEGMSEVKIENSSKDIVLKQKLSDITVTKTITFKPSGEYSVVVDTTKDTPFFVTPGHRPMADESMYLLVRGALIKGADEIITTIEDGDALGYEKFDGATIASSFDRYVASLFYNFDKGMNVSILKEANGDPLIFIQGNKELLINAYIGPKDSSILQSINPELTEAIEFGWFSFLAKPFFTVLLYINNYVDNWGWSIIIFTLLVKVVLFPLSYKGMMSMQKVKDLAPKMNDIKAKYKGDPAKMNMHMMELYRKNNANPMGGCLPMLLQIPVFFALYRVLLNAVELQGAEWILWINDLAVMDPYFVLPLLMGASMWFQQKITPTTFTDPLQEKIFKWFPVIMTIFFVYFPSGLVLYWLINNIFTIIQQYYINYAYAKQKQIAVEEHKKGKGNK